MIRTEFDTVARQMAERLVALEKDSPSIAPEDQDVTCRVCEKLRRPLSHLVGSAGVSSLFRRALTLATRESSALQEVQVLDDGTLKGLEGDAVQQTHILVSHLIQLLATFIGDGLTQRILEDIWPDLDASIESSERSDL